MQIIIALRRLLNKLAITGTATHVNLGFTAKDASTARLHLSYPFYLSARSFYAAP